MFTAATYFFIFLTTFGLSVLLTFGVKNLATKLGIVDKPGKERKIHTKSIPLMGGTAIFLAFFIMLFIEREGLFVGILGPRHWIGVFMGALFLIIGGFLDDKYDISPKKQFIFPILAALSVVAGGVGIEKVSSPFGGLLFLNSLQIPVIKWGEDVHHFMVVADSFTIIWLLGMMYTTKLLDAIDGLVTGVSAIGSLIIFLFTMTTKYYQPDIGLAALIFAAACLGFLVLNWNPAKIFLGEGGSLLTGFILGVLSIISGGKIAIALLIMGIPILDVAWTIIRRIRAGQNPFKFSDRLHLHHRLLDSGLGQKKTVLIYYGFSAIFGLSALFLQSKGKLLALLILIFIMLGIIIRFSIPKKA